MPTINKRFLLKLLLVVAAAAGGLAGAHTVQADRIPDALMAQADRAAEADNPDGAVRYLRQYLEFRPDDTDARERLAGLLLGTKDKPGRGSATELLFLYDKILRADPDRHAARREAMTTCLRLGRYSDAETHGDALLAKFPEDAGVWAKQAAAQAGLHKPEAARKSFDQAIKFAPTVPLTYQQYAQYLWRELKRPAEAKAVLDRMVAAMPAEVEAVPLRAAAAGTAAVVAGVRADRTEALLTRAKFDGYTAEGANSLPDLQAALALDPTQPDALFLLAEYYQKRKDLAAARDQLVAGVAAHPTDVRLIRALAWLDLNRGNIGLAVAALEDGLERLKGDKSGFELLVPLADLLVQLGETGRTEEIVKKLDGKTDKSSRMQVKYLKARLAMRRLDWGKASETLLDLRAEAVGLPGLESQANLLLAVCRQRQADTAGEQDALKLILNKDPAHVAARVALGQSHLNAGQFADAEKEFTEAVKSPYASGPTHALLVRLRAARLRATGNRSPAEWQVLDRVAAELPRAFGPGSSEPTLLRSELAQARGELATALTILREDAVRRPGDARLWAALADLTATAAGVAAGLGVLDEAQAAAGDGPDLRLARADLYARDPARLRPLGPLGDHIDAWPDGDQLRLLYGLMEVADRLGDDPAAIALYRRITARRPADQAIWEAMAERAARAGDAKAFADAKTAASKLDTSGKSAALCDAWKVLAAGSPAAPAVEAMTKAFGPAPDRAEACVALGKLHAAAGDPTAAEVLFNRAVRLEPTRFAPTEATLRYLAAQPDPAPLAGQFARLGRDHRWAGEPLRRVTRAATRGMSPDHARRLLDAVRSVVETQPGGLGWLGDTLLLAGFKTEAMACFANATTLRTTSPDDWLRLAVRSAEAGDSGTALQAMAAARKGLPPQWYLTTAAAFADSAAAPPNWSPDLSTAVEKRAFLQARLALKLSRYQRPEATALLGDYLKTPELPKADSAWAKRNLAMLLVIRGGKADRAEAMKLLDKADESAGETADERRATAAVLAALSRYLDGDERQAVLVRTTRVLGELAKYPAEAPRDAFLLAQMQRAVGTKESIRASYEVMGGLLNLDPKNIDYLIAGLDYALDANQSDVAAECAKRLLNLYPTDVRAVTAVARYECRAGRPERALTLAEGYARTADNSAGDLPAKQARAAELLDELARLPNVRRTEAGHKMVKGAVERYEGLAANRPEAVIAAAGLTAADGRPADAFVLIERFARGQPNRLKAAAGLAVLRAGVATDRQFALVRGWLDAALAEEPDSIPLKLNEGEFFALRGDYGPAEKAYESVLAADPRNVVALNNLAWILAPRPDAAGRAEELIARAVAEVGLTGELLDTRARVRIAAKQFELAEKDWKQALTQEQTPLRLFHKALAMLQQSKSAEAKDAFRKAKDRGLDEGMVHPSDRPAFRALEAGAN